MHLKNGMDTALLVIGLALVAPAGATTTYTYTDTQNSTFSGHFSVANALTDGSYSFLLPANQPSGFSDNFFTTSFVDGDNITRTPTVSLFNITIANGAVSVWDIRATTIFTIVQHTGSAGTGNVYHRNSTLIYHDTNVPYLPGNGGAYQSVIAQGDYKTYYTALPYQEAMTGVYYGPGTWSIASSAQPVPEPETYAMLLAGLGALVFMTRLR